MSLEIGQKFRDRDKRHPDRFVKIVDVQLPDPEGQQFAVCKVIRNGVTERRTVRIGVGTLKSRKYEPVAY